MELILLLLVVLILVGALPTWGYSSGWGYGPFGLILFIILVIAIFRYI